MSSTRRACNWTVAAASVGVVEALKDQGICRWNSVVRAAQQHAKHHMRSLSQAKKLSSSMATGNLRDEESEAVREVFENCHVLEQLGSQLNKICMLKKIPCSSQIVSWKSLKEDGLQIRGVNMHIGTAKRRMILKDCILWFLLLWLALKKTWIGFGRVHAPKMLIHTLQSP